MPMISGPFVPGFLAIGGILLAIALLAAAAVVVRLRRKAAGDGYVAVEGEVVASSSTNNWL